MSIKEPFMMRALETLPAITSWVLLTSPIWASFFIPVIVAYYIILFDLYFFIRSASLGINAVRGYIKIQQTIKMDWENKLKAYSTDIEHVRHVIFIPTYKEPTEILQRTLSFLSEQEFPAKQINICLATEEREKGVSKKAEELRKQFGGKFGNFWITNHKLSPGEVIGKSSNLAYAAKEVEKKITQASYDKNFIIATSCDADVSLHPKYLPVLTYEFLTNPNRYYRFWQAAILFYNNIWRVPIFIRVVHTIYSINGVASLMSPGANFNYSTYSLSWKLLERSDYWDADVIPEDWHLFFKSFFKERGEIELESIFLTHFADAVEGKNYWDAIKAQYLQSRRWAWGVTDIAYAIKQFILHRREVSFINFSFRFLRALEQHLLWPVNWWFLTLGATLPPIINPTFRYTNLGYNLPKIAAFILTFAIIFLIFVIIVDWLLKPPRPAYFKKTLLPFTIIQYVLLPVTGFIFSSLPGMDAHTRLIFGKRLEYKSTEKFIKPKGK